MNLPPLDCAGCTLCCRGDTITIRPDHGDDHRRWKTDYDPATGVRTLRKGTDGNCIYLGPKGCKIHGKQPAMCRAYDCREHFLQTVRMFSPAVVEMKLEQMPSMRHGRDLVTHSSSQSPPALQSY